MLSACSKTNPADRVLTPTATIKDIMDSVVDPSAEFLFESVAEIADEQGHAQFLADKIAALGGEPTIRPRPVPHRSVH